MKTAGVAAAGMTIATAFSPFSYAENEKVRVAAIGTGGQGSFHLRDGLGRAEKIQIVAVCDVYRPHLEGGYQNAGGGDVKTYLDYRELLDKESFDAAVIATPLHTHYGITMDCLDAGKWCFTEKTMCYDIEHCRDLVKKCHETGRFVQVGHQRRYNPNYIQAVRLAWEEGTVGRINHIDAQWHRNNDWRRPINDKIVLSEEEKVWIKDLERHINWRLYRESSGGLMTELCTHQLDIAQWFLDAMPTKVFGYGGIDYWRDGREVMDNINIVYEYEIGPESRGYRAINARNPYQDRMAINEPYKVRFCYSSICANAKKGACESIQGDDGTFELTEGTCFFYREPTSSVKWAEKAAKDAAEKNAVIITSGATLGLSNQARTDAIPVDVKSEKSVDAIQFEAFADDIARNGIPKANQMVGLRSAVAGLAGVKALREGVEVAIDPAWYTFDFETPDPSII